MIKIKITEELENLLKAHHGAIDDYENGVVRIFIVDQVNGVPAILSQIIKDNPELILTSFSFIQDHYGVAIFIKNHSKSGGSTYPKLIEWFKYLKKKVLYFLFFHANKFSVNLMELENLDLKLIIK